MKNGSIQAHAQERFAQVTGTFAFKVREAAAALLVLLVGLLLVPTQGWLGVPRAVVVPVLGILAPLVGLGLVWLWTRLRAPYELLEDYGQRLADPGDRIDETIGSIQERNAVVVFGIAEFRLIDLIKRLRLKLSSPISAEDIGFVASVVALDREIRLPKTQNNAYAGEEVLRELLVLGLVEEVPTIHAHFQWSDLGKQVLVRLGV